MGAVIKVTPAQRVEGEPTKGMVREKAFATDRLWAGYVRTAPGMTSGWHHHGGYDTAVYLLSGAVRFESGPGGNDVVEGAPGDFMLVPAGVIHRESNPSDVESHIIVIRSGTGVPTTNVEGPETG